MLLWATLSALVGHLEIEVLTCSSGAPSDRATKSL